jgi:osmotically-inducible protein OsmY
VKTDSEIKKDLEDELRWDPDIVAVGVAVAVLQQELPYASQFIKVTAKDGWLTLEGSLEWNFQRERAENAVRSVRGVIGISNDLVLEPRVAARDIKRKIEDVLKRSAELDANRIAVESSGSKAILRGSVR